MIRIGGLAILILCLPMGGSFAALNLIGTDIPNDDGTGILITWDPTSEQADAGAFIVYRSELPSGNAEEIGMALVRDGHYADKSVVPEKQYNYRLVGKDPVGNELVFSGGPFSAKAQWFNYEKLPVAVSMLIFSGCVIFFIHRTMSGKSLFIRKIAGLDALDEAVGRATEMGRPVFQVPGIGTISDVATLASLSIMRRVARKVAEYNVPFIVPCTEALVMTTAQEVVKTAYTEAGRPEMYKPENVSYLTYDQFGYAAGVDGMMLRDKPGAILLLGYFMAESLIMAETGNSIGAIQIAGTDQTSQLPFFVAACDYTLIGEELYAASSYLSREPVFLGSLKGQDLCKVIILSLIAVGVILATLAALGGETFPHLSEWYNQLFGAIGAGNEA